MLLLMVRRSQIKLFETDCQIRCWLKEKTSSGASTCGEIMTIVSALLAYISAASVCRHGPFMKIETVGLPISGIETAGCGAIPA